MIGTFASTKVARFKKKKNQCQDLQFLLQICNLSCLLYGYCLQDHIFFPSNKNERSDIGDVAKLAYKVMVSDFVKVIMCLLLGIL